MGRARLTAVASAVAVRPGHGDHRGAGSGPAQPAAAQAPGQPHAGQAPANPPPVAADPTLAQGQGRGGSPIQAARADDRGTNGITGTRRL